MRSYFIVHERVRDQFIATLTHDLRTPLSSAMISADRMIQNLLDTNVMEVGEKVSLVLSECNMAELITSVVSELSKSERSRIVLKGDPIPLDEKNLLFGAFQRSVSARQSGKKGWGIGLSQVRGSVEAHGGSLALDSGENIGSTFSIDIPIDSRPFQNL